MFTGKYFIEKLNMKEHPEGGYYCECIKAEDGMPDGRKLFTSIYYLLRDREVSHFHRLDADEIWYYHSGTALTVYVIGTDGSMRQEKLGLDAERGERPQVLIRKGEIFGAVADGTGYSLTGCMVSPGFEFEHFEIVPRNELLELYPQYENIIKKLTL